MKKRITHHSNSHDHQPPACHRSRLMHTLISSLGLRDWPPNTRVIIMPAHAGRQITPGLSSSILQALNSSSPRLPALLNLVSCPLASTTSRLPALLLHQNLVSPPTWHLLQQNLVSPPSCSNPLASLSQKGTSADVPVTLSTLSGRVLANHWRTYGL